MDIHYYQFILTLSVSIESIDVYDKAPIKNHNNQNNRPHHNTKYWTKKTKLQLKTPAFKISEYQSSTPQHERGSNKMYKRKQKASSKRMEHKKNWDLEIPQSNPPSSVSIYISWGEEDRKEGSQIGSCYYETVEQEGGEIFTASNRIRFFPFYCETMWNCRVAVQTICLYITVEQKGGRNSNGLFPIPHAVFFTQYLLSNPVSRF